MNRNLSKKKVLGFILTAMAVPVAGPVLIYFRIDVGALGAQLLRQLPTMCSIISIALLVAIIILIRRQSGEYRATWLIEQSMIDELHGAFQSVHLSMDRIE